MGSRYHDARQIDGVGGASSVTSKVAVVSPSQRPGVDVDYTFVQVAVGAETIDLTGNCGNMCAGVGPFAIQEGLVPVPAGFRSVDVRIFNTNTERLVVETVEVDEDGYVVEDGDCRIPGVKGPGSEIKVAFLDPAGSMTGRLFPSGKQSEWLRVEHDNDDAVSVLPPFSVEVTLIDAANPFVLVNAETLPALVRSQPRDSPVSLGVAESIRRLGAVRMGLAATVEAAARVCGTPKLAYVSRSPLVSTTDIIPGVGGEASAPADVQVLAYSMGRPHPSLQLTGGVGLASAVAMEGTVAGKLAKRGKRMEPPSVATDGFPPTPRRTPSPLSGLAGHDGSPFSGAASEASELLADVHDITKRNIRLAHSTGVMEVETWTRLGSEDGPAIDRCVVSRTARRLFEGNVFYYT
ncbi:hypothetical protein PG985_009635 [Apiospora marii]|uniref:uncharacterized protein n=1 Tax=Apiospora marii TaxID=335849 RepID=UPI0031328077